MLFVSSSTIYHLANPIHAEQLKNISYLYNDPIKNIFIFPALCLATQFCFVFSAEHFRAFVTSWHVCCV